MKKTSYYNSCCIDNNDRHRLSDGGHRIAKDINSILYLQVINITVICVLNDRKVMS